MNREYDIDLIIPLEAFKSNQARTLKQDKERKRRGTIKEIKRWVIGIIQAPFVMALWFFFYCFFIAIFG